MRVALIPARGGSQRIPRKNVRRFLGIPSIERVIRTVQASGTVDVIVVSTDDDEIAEVAERAGALVPFRRPARLADSRTGARPVIHHAIEQTGWQDDDVLAVVYPTAVLLTADDLIASSKLMESSGTEFVLSVAEFPSAVQRALILGEDGMLWPLNDAHLNSRSQDLTSAYHDLGQVYWGLVRAWRADKPVVSAACRPYVVDSWRVVDIDTPDDWERAELVYRTLYGHD